MLQKQPQKKPFVFSIYGGPHSCANATVYDEVNRNEIGVYLTVGVGHFANSLQDGRHERCWAVHVGNPSGLGLDEGRGYHSGSHDAGGDLGPALGHYGVLRPRFRQSVSIRSGE